MSSMGPTASSFGARFTNRFNVLKSSSELMKIFVAALVPELVIVAPMALLFNAGLVSLFQVQMAALVAVSLSGLIAGSLSWYFTKKDLEESDNHTSQLDQLIENLRDDLAPENTQTQENVPALNPTETINPLWEEQSIREIAPTHSSAVSDQTVNLHQDTHTENTQGDLLQFSSSDFDSSSDLSHGSKTPNSQGTHSSHPMQTRSRSKTAP